MRGWLNIELLAIVSVLYVFYNVIFNSILSHSYIKRIEDIKIMKKQIEKDLNKLQEKPIGKEYCDKKVKSLRRKISDLDKKRISPLEIDMKKFTNLSKLATFISIVVGIFLILSYVLPAFADVEIIGGGEIEPISDNNTTGIWKVIIKNGPISNLFHLENKKIIVRISFTNDKSINSGSSFLNPTPDVIKIDDKNVKEYMWDSLQESIEIRLVINSEKPFKNDTWFSAEIRTSTGIKFSHNI